MRSQKHQRQIDKKKVHIKIKSHHLTRHKLFSDKKRDSWPQHDK